MSLYLGTSVLVFALLLVGIAVDRLYRRFAARNPHLGPYRKEPDGQCGCCASCSDAATTCEKK